ncbi:hypothetical protein [Sphingomonas sp. CROZ-RG-20F-R02-07]|uniref:hypothetical protein n=1 Tax=Sphingomonas sp. CROZ-RG-20F-R02-07 TaxID=2914832 RepID=UPI001F56EE75|nr:hypothetical protein [Sphingomonas sp. CROZ-RG-20F-R02-07]
MTDRPSLHARRRAVRNLRTAPGFLTESRVERILALLNGAPAHPAAAIPLAPVAPAAVQPMEAPVAPPSAPIAPAAPPAPAPKRVAPAAPTTPALPAPAAAAPPPAANAVDQSMAVAPALVPTEDRLPPAPRRLAFIGTDAEIADRKAMIAAAAAKLGRAVIEVTKPAPRLGGPASSAPRKTYGGDNGSAAPAIDWLRSNGVSVKAATTGVFGTRYLVSNELGELDVAAVVALARRKGFAR